jgi:MFS family permease
MYELNSFHSGAAWWGISSDILGRRLAFNCTLAIAGVFGIAVGGGSSWVGICGMFAALGFGVGGSLPVDGALFLEFLPYASGNLLTMLSVAWPLGQLFSSLVAMLFISSNSCAENEECTREKNMGWRYTTFTLGSITFVMFLCRFLVSKFVFPI